MTPGLVFEGIPLKSIQRPIIEVAYLASRPIKWGRK